MLKLKAYIICLHNEYLKLRAETKNVLALFYTRKGGGIYVELDYIFSLFYRRYDGRGCPYVPVASRKI